MCLRAADETIDGETLRRLCELYATRLSQLGMMCLSETAVDDFGRVRAPPRFTPRRACDSRRRFRRSKFTEAL